MQKLYTKQELADILNISIHTINSFVGKGLVKPIYIGGSVRFTQDEIDRLTTKGTEESSEEK